MSTSLDPIIMLWDLVAIPRYETNSLNKKPMREHRVTIGRGTGRVNLKQQSTGIEGLVPQYFDVSFYIVKLVLYNLFQTDVFDKCIRNIHEYFAVTISHVLLLSKILKRIRQKKIHFGSLVHFGLVSPPPTPPPSPTKNPGYGPGNP